MDVEKWTGRRPLCGQKDAALNLNGESQAAHRVKRERDQPWMQPTGPTGDKN